MERILKTGAALAALFLAAACGPRGRVDRLRADAVAPVIVPLDEILPRELSLATEHGDTLKVTDPDGREVLIMKAVKDEDGEMVAVDFIDASVVTARFRNVAERGGKVDLRFQVIVPEELLDSRWQIRLHPRMTALGETVELDSVLITGRGYRKAQLRGYQQYEKFLASIITDSSRFIRMHDLEVFLRRNIPQVYQYKTDTSYVSDETFASVYGVTERQAVEHYTSQFRIRANERRKSRLDRMYERYVKAPVISDGIRLDTVTAGSDGSFRYDYVQTLNVLPGLTRADISLAGSVYEQEKKVLQVPESAPLTFYISSLSSLVDDRVKYLTKILERTVRENSVCWIEFEQGSHRVDRSLGDNDAEIGRIEGNLQELLENGQYDLDSILVTASCSPEGGWDHNARLSQQRSDAVADYFRNLTEVEMVSRSLPENWELLQQFVRDDPQLRSEEKAEIFSVLKEPDADRRDLLLASKPYYSYLRTRIYPRLRTVRFDFFLHRKGMVQDTVQTTVPDTLYMRGVQAIKDRRYTDALAVLRPYADLNTAIAYCSLDYNASAKDILGRLPADDKVEYMLALVCSREGDDAEAVQHYLNACRLNPALVHRGNLDPEIAVLINRYDLNNY